MGIVPFYIQLYFIKNDEEIETRTKLVDDLKTALRTQPIRFANELY
jgi:hypothetical protein